MIESPASMAAAAEGSEPERYNRGVPFTTIFFDLDDTLYPASTGLWPTLKLRMTRYMIERIGIPEAEVAGLREAYFRTYGTTLRGLQANHTIDTEDYLAYVHDVRLEDYLRPDPVQREVLSSLSTRNFIFTNADANHARRVLELLEVNQFFTDIIDVNRMEPHCKPSRGAFQLALEVAGEDQPARCMLVDDLRHTTRAASAFGLFSVLFGGAAANGDADAACGDWLSLRLLVNGDSP